MRSLELGILFRQRIVDDSKRGGARIQDDQLQLTPEYLSAKMK
jgi:hypothetical protein